MRRLRILLALLLALSTVARAFLPAPRLLGAVAGHPQHLQSTAPTCPSACEGSGSSSPSSFISKTGPVLAADLNDPNLLKIVTEVATDEDVNVLLWKCLGYVFNEASGTWSAAKVFPKWAAKFPAPPDLIGVTRRYDPETDRIVRNASMDLMRSIPRDFKGGVRSLSTSVGWAGFKLSELTPNKTRRAQSTNWLIYYREKLFGKTVDQLREERERERSIKEASAIDSLPSEIHYQKLRLDDTVSD